MWLGFHLHIFISFHDSIESVLNKCEAMCAIKKRSFEEN